MKTNEWSNIATVVIAICCLVLTGTALRRQVAGPRVNTVLSTPEAVADWAVYASEGQRIGPPRARVTITEFSDFQCPFCKKLNGSLIRLRAAYPNDVAIVYRHLPLPQHPHARNAAFASECAGVQGRFAEFVDLTMEAQDSIGARPWTAFAKAAGVGDLRAFDACLRDSTYHRRVARDEAEGKRLKARGTPTVLVNSWRMRGSLTYEAIDRLVQQELRLATK